MRFGRIVLFLTVAFSVAMAPIAFAATAAGPAVQMTESGMVDDCCPHAPPCDADTIPMNNCASMAACPAVAFGLSDSAIADAIPDWIGVALKPIRVENPHLRLTGLLPFRPPRV